MPRTPKPYYHDRDRCWVSYSAGDYLPSGRRKGVRNYEIGAPEGRDGPANRAAADLWLAGLIAAEADGERRASDPLLSDLVVAFLAYAERLVAAGSREMRTVDGHAHHLDTFASFRHGGRLYGDIPVSRLRPIDLSRFIRDGQARGLAPGYIRSIVVSVHAMLNWAARPVHDRAPGWPERILVENPFRGVERPKVPAPPRRYIGTGARRAFYAYARRRAHSPSGRVSGPAP